VVLAAAAGLFVWQRSEISEIEAKVKQKQEEVSNGKKVADPLYTGLDECTPANMGKCPAQ